MQSSPFHFCLNKIEKYLKTKKNERKELLTELTKGSLMMSN